MNSTMLRIFTHRCSNAILKGSRNSSLLLNNKELINIRNASTLPEYNTEKLGVVFNFLSNTTPVLKAQELLIDLHDYTGLTWTGTIILTTVIVRTTILLPMVIHQHYVSAQLENMNRELKTLENKIHKDVCQKAEQHKWDAKQIKWEYARTVKKTRQDLIVHYNCHPLKIVVLVILQVPIWVTLSTALRNLVYKLPYNDLVANIVCMQMSVGGYFWFKNLTLPDSTWIFPLIMGLTNLLVIEVQHITRLKQNNIISKIAINIIRIIVVFMVWIASQVNMCILLYWVTSSLYGLIQNLVLVSPRVKTFCRIPLTPSTISKPYKHIANKIYGYIRFLKY